MRVVIGALAGAVLGYLWYRMVGCSTGACPITSNPWISSMYGSLMGVMFTLS